VTLCCSLALLVPLVGCAGLTLPGPPGAPTSVPTRTAGPAPGASATLAPGVPSRLASPVVPATVTRAPAPAATSTPAPAAPGRTPTRLTTTQHYTVQPGDTLSGIAFRYGTTTDRLQAANGLSDPNRILVGQVPTIPAADTVLPTPTPHR